MTELFTDIPVLYIFMRTDLPSLNPGKAMAQAAHAANIVSEKFKDRPNYQEWVGNRGFGTTIVLGATLTEINKAVEDTELAGAFSGIVTDPTYPTPIPDEEIAAMLAPNFTPQRSETTGRITVYHPVVTCGFAFGQKSIITDKVTYLKLHQ